MGDSDEIPGAGKSIPLRSSSCKPSFDYTKLTILAERFATEVAKPRLFAGLPLVWAVGPLGPSRGWKVGQVGWGEQVKANAADAHRSGVVFRSNLASTVALPW